MTESCPRHDLITRLTDVMRLSEPLKSLVKARGPSEASNRRTTGRHFGMGHGPASNTAPGPSSLAAGPTIDSKLGDMGALGGIVVDPGSMRLIPKMLMGADQGYTWLIRCERQSKLGI